MWGSEFTPGDTLRAEAGPFSLCPGSGADLGGAAVTL